MNDNILHAIESLCYDITTSAKAEENQKRANAILALAFAGKFTPEEIEEDYTEDDSAAGAEKDKIKFPKPGEQFEYNGTSDASFAYIINGVAPACLFNPNIFE